MDLTWIITAILGIVVIYLLYVFSNKGMDYWEKRCGVPHVKPLPLFGSMLPMAVGKKTLHDITTDIYRAHSGERFVGFMMSKQPVLLVRDLELANKILIRDFRTFQDRFMPMDDDSDLNAAGLQSITGERWRVLRHKLTPTLTSGRLKNMFKQLKECSEEAVEYLKAKPNTDIEARNFVIRVVLNMIGAISFGVKVDALNEKKEKENALYQNTKNFFEPSFFLFVKFMIVTSVPKFAKLLGIKVVNNDVNNFFKSFLQSLIDCREKDKNKRNDFLQILLDLKKRESDLLSKAKVSESSNVLEENSDEPEDLELMEYLKQLDFNSASAVFTDQIIAGQAFLFISGGTDTVASVLSFTFLELALHEDVQRKLQDEVDGILEAEEFTYEAVRKMKYLEQVLNEAIRLRSPGGTITRVCLEDYKIPETDVVIEKGTFVHIPLNAIHLDPQYFPDPDTFNPDRLSDPDAIPKGAFMPFGDGPRICIAMRLALLEMKIIVATLFRHFNIKLSSKTKLPLKLDKSSVLPKARDGIWINFIPRKSGIN